MEKSIVANRGIGILKNNMRASILDSNTFILCLIGFLLSRARVVDDIAPLGVAFFLCVSTMDKYRLQVFISTLAGTLISFNQPINIVKYSICIAMIYLLSNYLKNVKSVWKISTIGMLIILPISIGQALIFGSYIYHISIMLVECILMLVSTYIFYYGVSVINKRASRKVTSSEEIVALTIIIIFSVIGIGDISILGVSIRNLFSNIVILILSITGGASLGAASGVIIGLVYFINNLTSSMYMGVYAFAGLISGGFGKVNKYLSIAGYIVGWSLIYIYTSGAGSNILEIRDILIASLFVMLIPEQTLKNIEKFIKGNGGLSDGIEDYLDRSREITNNRLRGMYKTYEDLANTFDRIREKDKILDQKDIAHIIDMVHNDECKKCGMKRRCWEAKFNYTYTMMNRILEQLEEYGELHIDNIPIDFRKDCIKPESIVKTSNYYYKMFAIDYSWQQKFSENRKLVANQIRYMSKSIEHMAKDLDRDIVFDMEMERNIIVELDRNNISVKRLNYISKENNEFEILIEKETCKDNKLCEQKMTKIISDIVGTELVARKMGCSCIGENCKIKLSRRQEYKVISEVSNMSKDGYIISGDNYTYMEISDGKYMMAISDGMGKGRKAYEESSVTIDLLEKMMDSKIDEEIIIDTINNILMLKSSDEMFSTLDLGIVDLNKGVLNTIKMGACSTYIKRNSGEIDLVSTASLPVGILSDVNIERDSRKIRDEDYIIMVSDGIIDAGKNNNLGDNWLIYFLKDLEITNPKEISKEILNKALDIQNNNIYDDMTVLVTKVYKY